MTQIVLRSIAVAALLNLPLVGLTAENAAAELRPSRTGAPLAQAGWEYWGPIPNPLPGVPYSKATSVERCPTIQGSNLPAHPFEANMLTVDDRGWHADGDVTRIGFDKRTGEWIARWYKLVPSSWSPRGVRRVEDFDTLAINIDPSGKSASLRLQTNPVREFVSPIRIVQAPGFVYVLIDHPNISGCVKLGGFVLPS